ncbi:MAG: N(4)-(beta-N-acetylglucosaminyl)-L-asparaginase [Gemmatimonadetes bacterium]|nr:N(4)-(beta-N-acetylglucosaminyl)-L-asparaginase [Gemmatimonadota bacterium]
MDTARPLFISTWAFGKIANEQSLRIAEQGGSVLDAVERGIHVAEADASNASVGLGGIPNAQGVVQLDACIMDGEGQRAGSVAAIEGILHPISVARRVMDETKHVMLVGEGAREFALEQGFASVDLLTEERRKAWEEWREKQGLRRAQSSRAADNHDTIALLGLDGEGRIAGGCSTSGWGYKLPGRVGDSPIIGSGLYVDGGVGAAGATGLGENVMRYCATFLVVEYIRQGLHPEEACVETIRRIIALDPRPVEELHLNFVALDKQGRFGAAGTNEGFQYAVTYPGYSEVLTGVGVGTGEIGPEGGNRR